MIGQTLADPAGVARSWGLMLWRIRKPVSTERSWRWGSIRMILFVDPSLSEKTEVLKQKGRILFGDQLSRPELVPSLSGIRGRR